MTLNFTRKKYFFLPLLAVILLLSACTKTGKVRDMDPKEAYGLLQNRLAILVDVREEQELKESGIAEGAAWMPTSKISENHADWTNFKKSLSKDKQVIFYCRSGARSGRVAELLAQEGFSTANAGGFGAWQALGLPVKKFP